MPMEKHTLERLLKDGLPGAHVLIKDLRGDGDHYEAHIHSSAFRGLSRIQQHQLVYAALKGAVGRELHALAIHTSAEAPSETTQGA